MKFKQKPTIILQLLFLLFFCLPTVQAQKTVDQIFTKSTTQVISLNDENLSAKSTQFNQSIDLGEYGVYDLSLEQTYLFSDDYMARRANKNNDDTKLPLTFKGTIQGQPSTLVSLTTSQDFLSGFIDTGEEVIFFEPHKNFNSDAEKNELIIYYQKDVIDQKHACAANHTDQQAEQIMPSNDQSKSGAAGCYEVEIVLAADYGMYQKHGGNTLSHITSVLSNVRANYDNEFNDPITFLVVDDYIATNSGMNLWSNTANASDLLSEFSTSDISNIGYDLASLWVTRDIWGTNDDGTINYSVAGVAYRPGVCGSRYNLMEDFSSSSASLRVAFAHEIGHNFSATHDAEGSSTIMAPSVNTTSTWSTQSKNQINAFYPGATCLCTSGDAADLTFRSCGASGQNGNTVTISSVQIQNIGTTSASAVKVGWYLSSNSTINTNDYLIGTRNTITLDVGYYVTLSLTADISNIPAGNYYLGAIIDYENSLVEFSEENNTGCVSSSANISIVEDTEPDLDITTCGTVSKSGNTVTVNNVVVKNIGTATAASTRLGYYLSTNTTINDNDYLIGTDYVGSLAVNGTSTESVSKNISTITPPIPAGTYYVGMRADYLSSLAESNENNNTCYDNSPKFTVTYGCKDATAHNYNPNATYADNTTCQTCSDGVKNGDETQVDCGGAKCSPCGNITVTNPGTGDTHAPGSVLNIQWTDNISENVLIRMYSSSGTYYNVTNSTASDGSYNYTTLSSVPAGQYRIYIRSISNSSVSDYGTYFTIQTTSSCTDGIQNGNETGVDCGGSCPPCKSDLDITTCGTVSKSGNTVTVSNVVVKNIGTATAASTRLGYYLSTNTTINNNDYLIGTDYVGSLAVNGTSTESISKNISTITPPIPAGTYYVGMRADYLSSLAESNENNNTCYDNSPKFTVTYDCKDATAHNYNPTATYADNTTCQTCSDGVKNGDETSVDCGGAKCNPCNTDLDITTCGTVSKSGNTVTVSNVVVKNIGTATAASTRLGYYLSTNTTINNNDYLIGTDYVSSLAVNGTSTESISKNISTITPPIPAGTYYVGMLADYQKTLSESNENNNTCYDNSPKFTVTYGCKDATAHNYNPNATYADNTTCQTCSDGIKNGDETQVDCGGAKCSPCGGITVTAPTGSDAYQPGDVISIKWTDNITENVLIRMYTSTGSYFTLTNSTASDGSFNYTIPSNRSPGQYRIYIRSITNGSINDYGDYFTIQALPPEGTITVTAPTGSDTYAPGDVINIKWTDNITENVLIRMYTSTGSYFTLTNSTASDGSFNYTIPSNRSPGQYRIYIRSITNGSINDYGEFFTIQAPPPQGMITVTAPNGSDTYAPGDIINIKWTDNVTENVLIKMYSSAGWFYNITGSTLSDGSYSYTTLGSVPDGQYRIYIQSTTDGSINDYSEYFTIQTTPQGTITVTAPNGSDTYAPGDVINIKWTDNITENVSIKMYSSAGWFYNITGSTLSDGSYSYTTLGSVPDGQYRIYVQSTTTSSINDYSNYFNIYASTNCRYTDSLALVDVFNAANGNTWRASIRWNLTQPMDTWHGVTLNQNKCVDRLAVFEEDFGGTLSPSICNLSEITYLDFSENQIGGTIPANIGNLTNLTFLSLGINKLTGAIPTSIGNLVNLTKLYLNGNQLVSIPASIGDLSSLESLILNQNQLTNVPASIGNLSNLKTLYLHNNQLTNIPSAIGNLSQLTSLALNSNQLTELPNSIGSLSQVGFLQLSDNQLSTLPASIGNLTKLSRLYLSKNKLTYLPASIGDLSNLSFLYFEDNLLTALPTNMVNLSKLHTLYAHKNKITGAMPEWLADLENLKTLVTYSNQFSGCYSDKLAVLCTRLNSYSSRNSYISNGNDFTITWEDFCNGVTCGTKVEQNQAIDTYNFPNPFTNHTTITYTLPKDSHVTLTVYDASGKQVALLQDNETRAGGTHTTTFEGGLYPAGMYYYTIQAGEYFGTQKMILMK